MLIIDQTGMSIFQNTVSSDHAVLLNGGGYGIYQNTLISMAQPIIPLMVWNNNSIQQFDLHDDMQKYCEWKEDSNSKSSQTSSVESLDIWVTPKKQARIKRKKENFKEEFIAYSNNILKRIDDIKDINKTILHKSEKPAKSKNSKHPEKRSKYIGVSKNGNNWQALVVIGPNKVYLGTYKNEIEASYVFDFYSIISHFTEAKVNRSYNATQILNMVTNFKNNNDDFDVVKYLKEYYN